MAGRQSRNRAGVSRAQQASHGSRVARIALGGGAQAVGHLANPRIALARLDLGDDLLQHVGPLQMMLGQFGIGGAGGRRNSLVQIGQLGDELLQLRIVGQIERAALAGRRFGSGGARNRSADEPPSVADLVHLAGLNPVAGAGVVVQQRAARVLDDLGPARGAFRSDALRSDRLQVNPRRLGAELGQLARPSPETSPRRS